MRYFFAAFMQPLARLLAGGVALEIDLCLNRASAFRTCALSWTGSRRPPRESM
jgi:hypothetical protein